MAKGEKKLGEAKAGSSQIGGCSERVCILTRGSTAVDGKHVDILFTQCCAVVESHPSTHGKRTAYSQVSWWGTPES